MNEITFTVGEKVYRLTNRNNGNKYDRALKDAGPNASPKQILAHYHKHAGNIQDSEGQRIEDGQFWAEEKARLADEPQQLKNKTNEELQEIMRNSIDNSYVPSSIYHKARLELEFRNSQHQVLPQEEVLKLAPEFHGVGINLKALWKKIKSRFNW